MAVSAQQLIQHLRAGGMSPLAATALVARWQQESGQNLNPRAVGDRSIPGASIGLGQWNRERQANLRASGLDINDPLDQATFALAEMGLGDKKIPGFGSEARAYKMMASADTPEEALAGAMAYERPQGFTWANPAAGHGYSNTARNYAALAGGGDLSAKATDFSNPITDYSISPSEADNATEALRNDTSNPISGYGGGAEGAAPPAEDKRGWLAKMMGRAKKNLKKKGPFPTDFGTVKPIDTPEQAVTTVMTPSQPGATYGAPQPDQRQQMAEALARLNTGQLFIGG